MEIVRRAASLKTAAGTIFNLVLPDDCRLCGRSLEHASRVPICPDCLTKPRPFTAEFFCAACQTPFLNRSPLDASGRCGLCRHGLTNFEAVYAFGEYAAELRGLIHLLKYRGMKPLLRPLGRMMTRALPRDQRFDALVPMPLHWTRCWQRGFNQSRLLAGEVSRRSGIPVVRALARKKRTLPQAGLTNAERRKNVRAAFAVRSGARVQGLHILLIDDVLTTGATVNACAAVLKRAGAARVSVLTLARADRRKLSLAQFEEVSGQ